MGAYAAASPQRASGCRSVLVEVSKDANDDGTRRYEGDCCWLVFALLMSLDDVMFIDGMCAGVWIGNAWISEEGDNGIKRVM